MLAKRLPEMVGSSSEIFNLSTKTAIFSRGLEFHGLRA
jgi:hypothetical protein